MAIGEKQMILGAKKRTLLIGLLMVVASASASYMKPTVKMADSMPSVNLEKMVPVQFGEWHSDSVVLEQIVNPERKVLLAKIYNQTLTRTYLDSHGTRIMLSIAYGGDQSDEMQIHRPEVCYTAQGFQVKKESLDTLSTKFGALPIKRLFAVQGGRNEPITYWITVGNKAVVVKGLQQKLAQLRYGLTGKVPEGMLVRISSISENEKEAYRIQDDFVREMLSSMSKVDRTRMTGNFES
jgi:EpsI family protein